MDSETLDVVIVLVALVGSIVVAVVLLLWAHRRAKPVEGVETPQIPASATRRQRRILEKLEPLPEIPTVMDLVRLEVEETGVDKIPGHEGLSGPVKLKVFRRDQSIVENCSHEAYGFVVRDGVAPEDAREDDVRLHCEKCGEVPVDDLDSGTEAGE